MAEAPSRTAPGGNELAGLAAWGLLGEMNPSWWHLGTLQKAAWPHGFLLVDRFAAAAGDTHGKAEPAISRVRFLALSREWGCASTVHQWVNLSAGPLWGCIVKVMEHS